MEQNRQPRNKTTTSYQLIFDRGSQHIQRAINILFNKWLWENWTDMCRKIKLDQLLTPHTKINSKWIKDLIRPETVKILKGDIGSKISAIAHSNILSDTSPQERETNEKINGTISD